jgi:pyridoxamine 5'-phosphate oxidase
MNKELDLSEVRRDYNKSSLSKNDLPDKPSTLFKAWFEVAQKTETDPTAMVLSTALKGQPNSRIVLLKKLDDLGLIFYTNYESTKGIEMEDNELVALNFYWPDSERQVRIKGSVSKISEADSDEYFSSRPKESQIGAIVSQQSREMVSRDELEKLVQSTSTEYLDKEITRPDYWGGYVVRPTEVEFWQGRISRLHDRFLYTEVGENWVIKRLNP